MNKRILLAMTLILALVSLRASAFAQAAAESILLGASSSSVTAKAGTALNSILNQSSKQLAGHLQQALPTTLGKTSHGGAQPATISPTKSTAVRTGATPATGLVITSIQGAAVTSCVQENQTSSATRNKNSAETVPTNCGDQHSASRSAPAEYKSVFTLSFQK